MQINRNYERGLVIDGLAVRKDEILKNCCEEGGWPSPTAWLFGSGRQLAT
jgi:hypothetical protein